MASNSAALVSVDEYLHTAYQPDCDYVDGRIEERNVGEGPHSLLHGSVCFLIPLTISLAECFAAIEE